MKRTKRALTLGLAALLTMSLAACGGSSGDAAVSAALEKLRTASSLDAKMELTMSYAGETEAETLTVTNTMTVAIFAEPLKLKADVEMKLAGGGEEYVRSLTTYAIQEGDAITQYATDGATWAKKSAGAEELAQYDTRSSLVRYLEGGAEYEESGSEQVDGRETVKYTGSVSGEALVTLLDDTGSLSSITSMSADQQAKIKENLKSLPPLTITVWVDQANGCPARFEMDMTGLLADMEANIDETLGHPGAGDDGSGAEVTGYLLRITCTNFDAATGFELPAEAASAQDVG